LNTLSLRWSLTKIWWSGNLRLPLDISLAIGRKTSSSLVMLSRQEFMLKILKMASSLGLEISRFLESLSRSTESESTLELDRETRSLLSTIP
jgi:hypothetical protein